MHQHILITGSTDGIGKLAAEMFAQKGHHVILHGRNADKLRHTIEHIKSTSNNRNITGYTANLSNIKAVKQFANQVLQEQPALNIVINNAGVFKTANTQVGALDIRFVVNYLSPFILTHTLLPLLEKNAPSKIINLSSAAQQPVSLKALEGKQPLSDQEAYAQSKLAITMWSFYLSQAYTNIQTVAVNPGSLLNTKMVQEAYGQFWSPASKGGQILYDLAIAPSSSKEIAQYFDNDQGHFAKAHPDAYDNHQINELVKHTQDLITQLGE